MADLRPQLPVKIVDPTTNSQEAGVDSGGNLQVILAANTGVDIGDVDITSIVPGFAATNLGKREDDGHTTLDVGVMSLAVRQDTTLATLSTTTLDYEPLHINEVGALYVGGYAPTALGKREDDPHVSLDVGVMSLAIRDDTPSAAVSGVTGDYEPLHVDANGALYSILNANSGVDIGDVDVTTVIPGVGATNLGKAEDAAHIDADTGVAMLAVRRDTASTMVNADNDYTFLTVDASGRLHVADPNAGAGSPSTPTLDEAGDVSLTAGTESTTEFRTVDVGADTFRLAGVDISGAAAFRAEIDIVDNDVVTIITTLFSFNGHLIYRPPHKDYNAKTWAGSAGFDGFQVLVTNLDTSETTDFYVTMYYED